VSSETGLLNSWSDNAPALVWRASGAGDGYSSVVIEDGLVFTTGRTGSDVHCVCFDVETGRKRWSTPVGSTTRNVMSTPTVHAGLVYALDPDGELFCLKADDGAVVWQRDFVTDFGGRSSGRGYGESPLIDGDRLICTPGGPDAMLAALDRRTGEVIWKSGLPDNGAGGQDTAAFSSIVVSQGAAIRQFVQLTSRGLAGFEANTGRFLWSYDGISNGRINIPTPIVTGDLVFSANGYHAGAVLLRLEPTDGGTGVEAREVYRLKGNRFQNHHGGYVLIGDHVYGGHGSNNGLPTCLDLQTGRVEWKRRGPGSGSASVVAADGHVYFRYQDGVIALIEASPDEYRLKGTFGLPGTGGDSWSHPVVADGKLYLREKNNLWVFDVKRGGSTSKPPVHIVDRGRNRIDRYAHDPQAPSERPLTIVTLDQKSILPDGSIDPQRLKELQQTSTSFVLSLAGSSVTGAGLKQLATVKRLTGLDVSFCRQINDDSFALLQSAERLSFLIAAGTSITEAGLKHVAGIRNLRALDLEFCEGVTDAACEAIGSMSELRALTLAKTGFEPVRVTDAGLAKLARLTKLEILNLTGNAVTDDGLKQLASLQHLHDLDLSRLAITDAGLKHLAAVKGLQRLVLLFSEGFAGPIVTDVGVKLLVPLDQLAELNLVDARITDEAVDDLIAFPKMSFLTLTGSRISPAGVERLRRAKPDCTVIAGSPDQK
jgi:outer membrane protein assembly factor BamB